MSVSAQVRLRGNLERNTHGSKCAPPEGQKLYSTVKLELHAFNQQNVNGDPPEVRRRSEGESQRGGGGGGGRRRGRKDGRAVVGTTRIQANPPKERGHPWEKTKTYLIIIYVYIFLKTNPAYPSLSGLSKTLTAACGRSKQGRTPGIRQLLFCFTRCSALPCS